MFAGMAELQQGQKLYEYAVLVTSLSEEVLSIAQLYRDRAEAENIFDELKNQWGWTGFTTGDVQRCQILARIIALIYNWWSLYTRLAIPHRHTEATTSRPLLYGVARQTRRDLQHTLVTEKRAEERDQLGGGDRGQLQAELAGSGFHFHRASGHRTGWSE